MLRRRRSAGPLLDIGTLRALEILRIIEAGWAYASACRGVHQGTLEVPLNGRLRWGMRQAVDEKVVRSHKKISILPGTESWTSATAEAPAGLTDIVIHLRDIRERQRMHGPHAVIECKRVAGGNSKLCRLYVKEGIDRFQTKKYAHNHSVAFMAGYLVAGNATEAAEGINAYLGKKGREAEMLRESSISDEASRRTSRHARPKTKEPLVLHHTFLSFGKTGN